MALTPFERFGRALGSLRGLSVGDALGSQYFVPVNHQALLRDETPPAPWRWIDDTEMACSVLAVLSCTVGGIDQDALAESFAIRHDFDRGYGPSVNRMLRLIRQEQGDWRVLAAGAFHGQGSWGNGAAMRVAPLGAWYAGEPEEAARQGALSALTTHTHPEGVAGAVAVAVAAALVAAPEGPPTGAHLLEAVADLVPPSSVRAGLHRARGLLDHADVSVAAAVLGCGRRTTAHDTVPFALWTAARHLGDFTTAFWATARAGGDVDTTCAITGGVLAAHPDGAPPTDWLAATEPLPDWLPRALRRAPGPPPSAHVTKALPHTR